MALLLALALLAAPAAAQEPQAAPASSTAPAAPALPAAPAPQAPAPPSLSDPDDSVRLKAVEGLLAERNEKNYQAMEEAMNSDLNDKVRQAAALGLLRYEGSPALLAVEEFLSDEEGEQVREAVCLALATTTLHADNPQATALLATRLNEDESPRVRLAAIKALQVRKDRRALDDLRRVMAKDPDPLVRAGARKAHQLLSKPLPIVRPVVKTIKPAPYETKKGRDRCGDGNGWCECSNEAVKLTPRCMPREDCQQKYDNVYRRNGYTCLWDSQALN